MSEEKQPEASTNYVIEIKKNSALNKPLLINFKQSKPTQRIEKIKPKSFMNTNARSNTN